MARVPLELSRTEGRVVGAVVVAHVLGELATRVVHNATGVWWPSVAVAVAFVMSLVVSATYLARTRRRSVASVLALGLPNFLTRDHAS